MTSAAIYFERLSTGIWVLRPRPYKTRFIVSSTVVSMMVMIIIACAINSLPWWKGSTESLQKTWVPFEGM
jgi:hypothetical protein